MEERRFVRLFLLVPSVLVLYFVFRIFQPFITPILLAIVLASLFYPAYNWLANRLGGRTNWAALISCVAVTAIIVIPVVLLIVQLAGQANQVYQNVQDAVQNPNSDWKGMLDPQRMREQPLIGSLLDFIDDYVPLEQLQERVLGGLADWLRTISAFLFRHSTAIITGLANLLTSFFIMILSLFFLFRDGSALVSQMRSWTPLSEEYEQLIIDKFQEVAGATVVGSLATAIAQGVAGAIVFWILGIPNVLLWGSLMALFSLVPLVGTAIVWVPWTVYLVSVGSVGRAVALVLAALLFVGMIDNVLRPLLIEGKVKMHTMLIFFSIMGGIGYFGIIGMIFGPIVVALGLTFLELYKIEFKQELAKPGHVAVTPPAAEAKGP